MSFINNLIDRAVQSAPDIRPRLRGKFERDLPANDAFADSDGIAPGINDPKIAPDLILPLEQRKREAHSPLLKDPPDEPVQEIQRTSVRRPATTQQVDDDIQPVKHTRFDPSYQLVDPPRLESPLPAEKSDSGNGSYLNSIVRTLSENVPAEKNTGSENQQKNASRPIAIESQNVTVVNERRQPLPNLKAPTQHTSSEEQPKAAFKQQATPFMNRRPEVAVNTSTINISIGRIEVRVSQPPAQSPPKPKKEGIPIMSLDEYLQKRNKVTK